MKSTATALLILAALLLASRAPVALGISDAECDTGAQQARGQGGDFKACVAASPPGTINPDCCGKLSALAEYADCLDIQRFQDEANSFLQPETSFGAVKSACIGRRR